jgi:hypothetical protein
MMINKKHFTRLLIVCLGLLFVSCQLKESTNPTIVTPTSKNVHYVATMISSSNSPSPVITYINLNGGTTQVSDMSLDVTQSMTVGMTAALSATCVGTYNPIQSAATASIALKIYVNDTLKTQGNDLKSDATSNVTASASCSYVIK